MSRLLSCFFRGALPGVFLLFSGSVVFALGNDSTPLSGVYYAVGGSIYNNAYRFVDDRLDKIVVDEDAAPKEEDWEEDWVQQLEVLHNDGQVVVTVEREGDWSRIEAFAVVESHHPAFALARQRSPELDIRNENDVASAVDAFSRREARPWDALTQRPYFTVREWQAARALPDVADARREDVIEVLNARREAGRLLTLFLAENEVRSPQRFASQASALMFDKQWLRQGYWPFGEGSLHTLMARFEEDEEIQALLNTPLLQ